GEARTSPGLIPACCPKVGDCVGQMTLSSPQVSVIVPARNAEGHLDEALRSLALQEYGDFEAIVIDDASNDRTHAIARRWSERDTRFSVRSVEGCGIAAALNRGRTFARGALIARMDADDRAHPQRLREQVRFMSRNLDVVACGTWARTFGQTSRVTW